MEFLSDRFTIAGSEFFIFKANVILLHLATDNSWRKELKTTFTIFTSIQFMRSITILLADDDQDDHDFFREAVNSINDINCTVKQVYNGLQAMDYLQNASD